MAEEAPRATAVSGFGSSGGGGGAAGGRRGYARGGDRSWAMSSAGDEGEEAPAFEGAGSRGGGAKRGQRSGGGGSGGASGDGDRPKGGTKKGVLVLAGPGDLTALSQACPSLRELVISGDPDQAASLVTSAVRYGTATGSFYTR